MRIVHNFNVRLTACVREASSSFVQRGLCVIACSPKFIFSHLACTALFVRPENLHASKRASQSSVPKYFTYMNMHT